MDRVLDLLITDAVDRGECPPRPDDVSPYQWWKHYLYEDGTDGLAMYPGRSGQ